MSSQARGTFAALYAAYEPQVYAYCRRRFAAEVAEDVLADVFLTAWQKIESAPSGEDALRWLCGGSTGLPI
ncbi:MAG: sigma factor [Acidimicrobiia bacterium]